MLNKLNFKSHRPAQTTGPPQHSSPVGTSTVLPAPSTGIPAALHSSSRSSASIHLIFTLPPRPFSFPAYLTPAATSNSWIRRPPPNCALAYDRARPPSSSSTDIGVRISRAWAKSKAGRSHFIESPPNEIHATNNETFFLPRHSPRFSRRQLINHASALVFSPR